MSRGFVRHPKPRAPCPNLPWAGFDAASEVSVDAQTSSCVQLITVDEEEEKDEKEEERYSADKGAGSGISIADSQALPSFPTCPTHHLPNLSGSTRQSRAHNDIIHGTFCVLYLRH